MTRDEARRQLVAAIAGPLKLKVSRETWLAAAALGGLRQAANDSIRTAHRSRGDDKNASGDLQGSFGELLVAATIELRLPNASVRFAPLNWDVPGDDVDAVVEISSNEFLVEAKCHLHEANKRLFLINSIAADRSKRRGALSFVPVLSTAGAEVALVGRPLMMEKVLEWPLRDFGYGDAARAVDLDAFVASHFNCTVTEALGKIGKGRVAERAELTQVSAATRERFDSLRLSGLQIEQTPLAATATLAALA